MACERLIERDISKMRVDQKVNTRRFFAATAMHLKFEGAAVHTDTEIMEKLDAAEKNYVLQGQPASLNDILDVVRQADFRLIKDRKFVIERIKELRKVDRFYRDHADQLAAPIFTFNRAHSDFPGDVQNRYSSASAWDQK